jgi:hypothetical protein
MIEVIRSFGTSVLTRAKRRNIPEDAILDANSLASYVRKFACLKSQVCRLCGLVVRVPGYTSGGPAFSSRRYHFS